MPASSRSIHRAHRYVQPDASPTPFPVSLGFAVPVTGVLDPAVVCASGSSASIPVASQGYALYVNSFSRNISLALGSNTFSQYLYDNDVDDPLPQQGVGSCIVRTTFT